MISRIATPVNVLRNNKGIVLVIGMLLITILSFIGIAANNSIIADTAIASNYINSNQAFYIAEAGLERGRLHCVQEYITNSWTNYNTLINTTIFYNISFGGGSYTVTVVNTPGDSGGSSNDTDAIITIVSTGIYRGTSTQLKTTIRMNNVTFPPNFPAAVSLVGEANATFPTSGLDITKWYIDGRDWRLTDTNATGPTGTSIKNGISVCDISSPSSQTPASAQTGVINALSASQKTHVMGTGNTDTTGPPSVGISSDLSKQQMSNLANALRGVADYTKTNPANMTASTSGVNNCASFGGSSTCFGNTSNPKIVYVNKTNSSALYFQGNITGAGILIIDIPQGINDRDVYFEGNLDWTGLVIVNGRKTDVCLY